MVTTTTPTTTTRTTLSLPRAVGFAAAKKKHFLSDQWRGGGGDTQTLLLLRGIRKGSNADFPFLFHCLESPPPTNGNSPTYPGRQAEGREQCHKEMGEREKEEEEEGPSLPGLSWLAWLSFSSSPSPFLAFKWKYVGGRRRRATGKRGTLDLGCFESILGTFRSGANENSIIISWRRRWRQCAREAFPLSLQRLFVITREGCLKQGTSLLIPQKIYKMSLNEEAP